MGGVAASWAALMPIEAPEAQQAQSHVTSHELLRRAAPPRAGEQVNSNRRLAEEMSVNISIGFGLAG
jgi:hypothetical protein